MANFLTVEDSLQIAAEIFNPLGAAIVGDMQQLDSLAQSGHIVLIGKIDRSWQDSGYILKRFGKRVSQLRRKYRDFAAKGIGSGRESCWKRSYSEYGRMVSSAPSSL